jgi:phosphatidate cytidylyltransferase
MIIVGTTEGFLQAIGSMFWGVMMAGYSLSYVAYLSVFSSEMGFQAGPLGLMLYLLFITEINDASQYMWGKILGKRKIVPTMSPKKTYEGFFGGIITTVVFSMLLAPFLTPLNYTFAALVGVLISVSGFLGDITMSALKRDVRVKDFGTLLPGHGGLLDRIDSLIFTAPLFFHLMYWYFK